MGLLFDARYDRSLVTFLYWLLTWTADNKDEERQEPRSHRAFLITDGFLREVNVTFESVANAHFNSRLIVVTLVQRDLVTNVYIHIIALRTTILLQI